MAFISKESDFNVDEHSGLVVGVASILGVHDSGRHTHTKDQLLFSQRGCMVITMAGMKCVLPPIRAAWIPAGIEHSAQMTNVSHYRSLFFNESLQSKLSRKMRILDVNPLFLALIDRMAMWSFDKSEDEMINSLNLFIEELNAAKDTHLNLPLPYDYRLKDWLLKVNNDDFLAPTLTQLSTEVGASTKTITRIFTKETGMPYQSWRQQWRVLAAIELLSKQLRVTDIAYRLGFSSDSAFISFFRQKTGFTPLHFIEKSGINQQSDQTALFNN